MHHNAPSFSNNKSSQMKFDSDDEPDVFEIDKDIACITPSRFKPDLFDEINGNIVKYENESTNCDTNEPERTILIALGE
uniref:Uncharacterized protein n=1 Tax=Heterorhabditis bacteriophora TaxID=37862 RepID=A0A1I7WXC1_HETBA